MQSTILRFYLCKENPTPPKAERHMGYEASPSAPFPRCPARSLRSPTSAVPPIPAAPKTQRLSGSFSNTWHLTCPSSPLRGETRTSSPAPSGSTRSSYPRGGQSRREGRQLPATDPGRDRRDASCLPRVTQPRPGWSWQPPVPSRPSLPGLNPRCATRPRRHQLRR